VIVGDTSSPGISDKFQATGANVGNCNGSTYQGPDLVYAVTPTVSGMLTASLNGSYYHQVVRVHSACSGLASTELACQFAYMNNATGPTNAIPVTGGTVYYVIADSWSSGSGSFTLTITLM
jgi:hypothetical protein